MSDDILEGMIRQSTNNPLPKELPILVIKGERDVPYVELDIEGEQKAIDVIVEMGKEHATDADYFNIGLTHGLKEFIKQHKEQ